MRSVAHLKFVGKCHRRGLPKVLHPSLQLISQNKARLQILPSLRSHIESGHEPYVLNRVYTCVCNSVGEIHGCPSSSNLDELSDESVWSLDGSMEHQETLILGFQARISDPVKDACAGCKSKHFELCRMRLT